MVSEEIYCTGCLYLTTDYDDEGRCPRCQVEDHKWEVCAARDLPMDSGPEARTHR